MLQTPKYHICSVKRPTKNPEWNEWFYLQYMVYLKKKRYMMGMGEKLRNIQKTKQRKKLPVWLPSHPPVYEVEADYFPVSENTENKPGLP